MSVKELIIKLFPGIYVKKNFSVLDTANFTNYKQKNIEPELLLLPFLLEKQKSFVDVGSNKGLFLYSASKIIPPSQIFGFEPNPLLNKKITSVFKKIKIFNYALSDKSGDAVLTIPFTGNQPDDSLGNIDQTEVSENAFNFKVKLKTLDESLSEVNAKHIGLIKIDVEGHELDVIKGAGKTITNNKPVLIVEIEQRHHKEPVKEILETLIKEYAYKVYYFLPSKNKLVDFSTEPIIYQSKADFGTINYVNNFVFVSNNTKAAELLEKINSEIGKN